MLKMEKIGLSRKRGFTLVELLVTIAVMSVMLLVGMPALLSQISHIHLSRSARDVLGELNAARMKAISRNMEYRVFFTRNPTPQADTYRVQFRTSPAAAWQNDATIRSIQKNVDITAPGAGDFNVEFNPGGSVEVAASICLRNNNDTSDKMTVQVIAATGRTAIGDGC